MRKIFLIFLLIHVLQGSNCAVTEGYLHRVKRSNAKENEAKKPDNLTETPSPAAEKNKNSTNATGKPKRDNNDEMATEMMHTAIGKFNSKMPMAIHVHHIKLNRTEPAAWRDFRRNWDNQHCSDIQPRHTKSLLLLHPRNNKDANHGDEHNDEKFIEFLTGKSAGGNSDSKHLERYARAFFAKENTKKSKRNAMKSAMHHKLHKDNKDHKHKRSDVDSSIDNFLRLTNMLVEMSGAGGGVNGAGIGVSSVNVLPRPESSFHTVHHGDVEMMSPFADGRLTEVIYKPITIDASNGNGGDDVALIGANEFLSNEFGGIPQPQHAILPIEATGYHEFTLPLPLMSNFGPLKILTNAVESGISLSSVADKDENDSDEYEMTCPVHFKRSTDAVTGLSKDGNGGGGGGGGVLELCTCHLYRKKKQVL